MALSEKKLIEMGKRIYNNKMIEQKNEKGEIIVSDVNDIKELCQRVFGDGSSTPDPSLLHQFNNIIVKTADQVAEPKIDEIMTILAQYEKANPGDVKMYELPKENKVKVLWTALGSGVDLVRISPEITRKPAVPQAFTFGAYYEPIDFVKNSVAAFNDAVNKVAEAKIQKYYDIIREVASAAIAQGDIPKNNIKNGTNLTLNDFRKVESVMIRLGGRPTFVGDSLLIDHFANQQVTDPVFKELLYDDKKKELMGELYARAISKTIAVNLTNPFIDNDNSKVALPVNEGYIFAGTMSGKKPFYITEYGGIRQYTEQDAETERIKLKIVFEADVTLMYGRQIGKITDDSIQL